MYCFLIVTDSLTYPYLSHKKKISISDLILMSDTTNTVSHINIYTVKNILSIGKCTQEEFDSIKKQYWEEPTKFGSTIKFKSDTYKIISIPENSCEACDIRSLKGIFPNICSKFNNLNNGNCNHKGYKKL